MTEVQELKDKHGKVVAVMLAAGSLSDLMAAAESVLSEFPAAGCWCASVHVSHSQDGWTAWVDSPLLADRRLVNPHGDDCDCWNCLGGSYMPG